MSGADSPRGYDGLIDPSQFPFRSEQMDLESLADAAETVRGMGTGVSEAADDLVGSWSRLQPVYGGPREEQVWGLMSPVAGTAGRLESDMTTAARRLDDLASSLVVLKAQMADLEERATAFRASCLIGVRAPVTEGAEFVVTLGTEWAIIPWNQDTDTVARNEDLLLEHAKLVERITTATAECHNALMDLVAWATDAHDVEGVSAQELMDRRVEYPWGTPVAEDRNWAESIGHGAYMFGFNIAAGVTGLALGYDLRMEEYRDGYRGELAAGLGNAWLSSSVSAAWMMLAASSPGVASWVQEQMPDDARRWLHDRQVVTASMGGDLVGVDVQAHLAGEDALWRWREDGIATGTESVLNIGSMFVPSGGAASGALRTGSFGARLLRITTGAADFVIPGTSALTYGGIRVASGLRTAITRLDDVPVVQPNAAGVAGEVVDAADPNTIGVDRPLSDELFGDGVDGGGGGNSVDASPVELPEAVPPVDSWQIVDLETLTDGPIPTPQEVLMPEGSLIGAPGTSPEIRLIHGDHSAAQYLFGSLAHGGEIVFQSDRLLRVRLPNDAGWVGFRTKMTKSGADTIATVDVNLDGVPIEKVKFIYDYT